MEDGSEEIAAFIAQAQADPLQHCAYLGTTTEAILTYFDETPVRFATSRRDGSLAGVFGMEHDPGLRRAWLLGPWISANDWVDVADQLWTDVLKSLPAPTEELEMAYDVRNTRVGRFADARGFIEFSDSDSMGFERERFRPTSVPIEVELVSEETRQQVEELHDRLFPKTWLPGATMIARISEHRPVTVVRSGETVLGYLAAEVNPTTGEAAIDFVGVHEEARGRGIARALIEDSLTWMFSHEGVEQAELMVRRDNPMAAGLYQALGFRSMRRFIGVRRAHEVV